jgi:glycosyltransferase involved in cell wall biosynthesis
VSVGNLRREKGQDVLIRGFAAIAAEFPDARLTIVGAGPSGEFLTRLAADVGVAGRVDFTGAVSEPWGHLAAADIFVAPSRSEALGMAIIEAMAAGLPVIASRVGGIPELVRDTETGYLVTVGDHDALADRLRHLLTSSDARRAMGAAGARVVADMTMERAVDRYVDLYARLARNRPRPRN